MRRYLAYLATIPALFVPIAASAHVRYLMPEEGFEKVSGIDVQFLLSALKEPTNRLLILGTLAGALVLFLFARVVPVLRKELSTINSRAGSYAPLIPWMLRLSIGIALIGAGSAEYLVSPALPGMAAFSGVQILLGFLLMAGFLVTPAAIGALVLFVIALTRDSYVLGNLDFAAAALAILALDDGRPGVDDILKLPHFSPVRFLKNYVPLILRLGVGVGMTYLALYEKLLNPHASAFIVENFGLQGVLPVSPQMWVLSAGLIELAIGTALILGFRTRLAATIAFIVLSLSFFYFEESVAAHITLFGVLSVLFVTRGGNWSLDSRLST